MSKDTTMKKNWFVGITATKGSKKRVYEGDMHENKLVGTYETEEAAAQAVAEHNAQMTTEFLKSWAEEIAILSLGRISADALYTAAVEAATAGKNLDDPAVRQALKAAATRH